MQAPTTDPLLLGFDNTGISGPLPEGWSQQLPGFGGLISSNTGLTGMPGGASVGHKAALQACSWLLGVLMCSPVQLVASIIRPCAPDAACPPVFP